MFAPDLGAHSLKLQNPHRSIEKLPDWVSVYSLVRKKTDAFEKCTFICKHLMIDLQKPLMLKVYMSSITS